MDQESTPNSKYRHVRDIADGGMGTVSLAVREDGVFRRAYAVKRLLPGHRNDPRVRAMFLEEARLAGLLHHPNIVSVVDIGEDQDGPYLVMDYVQGVSLVDFIKASRESEEFVPVQICVRIVKQIAEGLHAAHELRSHDGTQLELVHRDVSPQNILVGYDGVARLTDFGIAKALGRRERTNTGILKGKIGYLSPEQLQFEHPTRRSDIFSLGVVLYEILSSKRLYSEDNDVDAARRVLKEPPPDIGEVRGDAHPVLVQLLFRMLAKEPELRPETARDVAEELDEILFELVASDGPIQVADYVGTRFGDRQSQQMSEVDELTAGLGPFHIISSRPRSALKKLGAPVLLALLLMATAMGAWAFLRQQAEVQSSASAAVPPIPGTPTEPPPASTPPAPTKDEAMPVAEASREVASSAERAPTREPIRKPPSKRESETLPEKPAPVARPQRKVPPADKPVERTPVADKLMTWDE